MRPLFVKFLKPFFVFLLFAFITTESKATHYMGVDIAYRCLGPCIYRITHKAYFDCTPGTATTPLPGPGPTPSITFAGTPAGCNSTPLPAGPWVQVRYVEVTPVCPGFLTKCNSASSSINGVLEAHYYRDYDFCIGGSTPCTKFTLSWYNCCRNNAITSGSASNGIYTGKTVIDLSITPCNSSPTFINVPVPYICAGQTQTFIQGAFDPDGDSLSYRLVPCISNAGTNVTYGGGYSPTAPLGPDWRVTLDPFTGEIEMAPNPNGSPVVGVLCIEVEEWRNRVKIGGVVRDMQITVITNCTSSNPDVPPITNPTLTNLPVGTLGPKLLRACAGAPICFDVPVTSKDTSLNYQLIWNKVRNTMVGATFFSPANPAIQDTIRGKAPLGRFCWTPTAPGTYLLDVIVIDDACPIPGSASVTYLINVTQPLINSTISAQPINNCNSVQLSAVPRSNIPSTYKNYSYKWRGNGNLQPLYNSNLGDSSLVHSYPMPATYFVDLTITDTFGCSHSFRDFVTLSTGVTADAGPDLTLCSGFQFKLGTPAIPGQYYNWTPKKGLNDSTRAQPNFTLVNLNPGIVDTVDYVLYVTDSICETEDYVRVVINPSLQVRISPSRPTICRGDSITLRASGGTRYLWSTGDTTASIRYPYSNTTTLSVVTFDNGCTSQAEFVTIQVNPGPPGNISGSFKVCEGQSATLIASGATTYNWSTTPINTALIIVANVTQDTTVWMVPQDANGCLGDSVFATVSPYANPVPDFSPSTVCEGIATEFLDQSTIAEGIIIDWIWDFGDGNTSKLQNPTHTYLAAGSYTVSLKVTSDNGCEASLQRTVTVENLPDAIFDFTNICQGSPTVFTNRSVINAPGTITGIAWKFGDGNSSVGNLTTHVYDTSGYYNTTLVVVSAAGCVDSFTQTVFVHPIPVASFEVTNACQDSVVFSYNGSAVGGGLDQITTYAWDFGDPASGGNNFSSKKQPTHVYAQAGNKTVTLTVTTANGCVNSTTREIVVFEEPRADFNVNGHCELDHVYFTDATQISSATPIVSWNWDFGNGLKSDAPDPFTKYADVGPGTYQVTLKVISSEGCSKTVKKNIVIDPNPRANFVG